LRRGSRRQLKVAADRLPSWAIVSPKRLQHIQRVAALLDQWGAAMSLPVAEWDRWLRAGWLHDALRDAPLDELRRLVPGCDWDEELLHGPAAARKAREALEARESDPEVLSAVEWHSVGHEGWGMTGKALYCADFLDPERKFDREARAELAKRFPEDPDAVFRDVVTRRVSWTERSGWPLLEPTRRLWLSLR
jgi:HD superfamily phosphohydrolase YqeK